MASTDRNEKASCPIRANKKVWEEFQPRIIAVHDQLAVLFRIKLRKPGVLRRECGGGV